MQNKTRRTRTELRVLQASEITRHKHDIEEIKPAINACVK